MSELPELPIGRPAGPIRHTYVVLRNRVLGGFFLALPIFLTFVIVIWVYNKLVDWVFGPIYLRVVEYLYRNEENRALEQGLESGGPVDLPFYLEYVAAPIVTLGIVLGLLFSLGMLFKSRVHRAVDWILLQVPVISWVYSVIVKVVETLRSSEDNKPRFQRVVLVEFPHPGTKVPAFVTSSCIDEETGKKILCLYVPTTPIPTSGYMLLVPEESVVELTWDLQETLEAIISGGVTAPPRVRYFSSANLESQ